MTISTNSETLPIDNETNQAMIAWRHDLHAHPELAYKENRTAAIVAESLTAFGLEVHEGIATTGVVGVLDFGDGPSIGLRADMDALPIHEENNLDYASAYSGCMHACGHDGHTAMLLGAAKALSKRTDLSGRIVFIFQPAEENEGGAKAMIEDGLFTRFPVDAVFGLHNMPGIPVGTIMVKPGYVSAAFDTFTISIEGKGGHGAMPEQANDPIPVAASLTMALNTIVSRNIKALDAAVITIGQLEAGSSYNVIPDKAMLKGSCRSMSSEVQKLIKRRMHEICEGISIAYNVTIKCIYEERYPAVFNTEDETSLLKEALSSTDFQLITDFEALMGSEDFAFLSKEAKGCYFIIGNGTGTGPLHSPTYNFNDSALSVGASAWIKLAEQALAARP